MARIVVIEDNAANLGLMGYLLTAAGHLVVGRRDGQTGLDEVLRERPDAVLCDIQLPRLSGLAIARALRAAADRRDVPLVAVSALAMRGDRENALAAGFDGYIEKPIQPEAFVAQVEAFLPAGLRRGLTATARQPSPVAARPTGGPARRTLLVVDDVEANVRLMRAIFENAGYSVLSAGNIAAGLALLRAEPVELVLSDVHMPGGDGFAFRRAALAEPALADIPFILLSSSEASAEDRRMAQGLGVRQLVERPVEPRILLQTVEDCLRARR